MSKTKPAPQKKVLIVDDHPILRQGIAQLVSSEPDLLVCGEAPDADLEEAYLPYCASMGCGRL